MNRYRYLLIKISWNCSFRLYIFVYKPGSYAVKIAFRGEKGLTLKSSFFFTKSFFQIRSFVLTQKTFWLQTVIAFCWFKCLNLLLYIIQVYPAHLPTTGPPRLWPVHPQAGGAGLTDLLFKIKSNNLPKKLRRLIEN